MAYDQGLAQRVREQLDGHPGLTEKQMFGGLAFMLRGNMCVGVSGDDLIVRLDPEEYEEAVARPGARVFDFTGRAMKGWVVAGAEAIDDDEALSGWIGAATRFVRSLPAKAPAASKRRREPG